MNNRLSSRFTKEMRDYIIKTAPKTTIKELAEGFNKKFGTHYAIGTIQNQKLRLGIKSLDSKFKKGRKAINAKPLGTEMTSRGKTYIKVDYPVDKRKSHRNYWEPKQRYMYKKYHGFIPDNSAILFLNCDKTDFSKDNLIAVDKQIQRILVRMKLLPNKPCDKEITKTAIMIAELYTKINQLKNIIK